MSRTKVKTKVADPQKEILSLKNKHFYNSLESILTKRFNIYDLAIIFIFSFLMQTRNQAEYELKKICNEFAIKIYCIVGTNILYLANTVTNLNNEMNIILTTIICSFMNVSIFLYFKYKAYKPDHLFLSRFLKVSEKTNLSF